ncbi:hypothetical protein ES705_37501 [subsurface metagenome]
MGTILDFIWDLAEATIKWLIYGDCGENPDF